jgi:acyl-CoA synthetase (AMP-forming)/AMP-acid ligase II
MEFSTLVDALGKRARHQPDKKAYTFLKDGEIEADTLNYQKLERLARAIAAKLQSFNARGQRALLLYPPGLEFIAAFFGCLYAGVIAVPAYPPRANQSISSTARRKSKVKSQKSKSFNFGVSGCFEW